MQMWKRIRLGKRVRVLCLCCKNLVHFCRQSIKVNAHYTLPDLLTLIIFQLVTSESKIGPGDLCLSGRYNKLLLLCTINSSSLLFSTAPAHFARTKKSEIRVKNPRIT